jgi:hypothetical protein
LVKSIGDYEFTQIIPSGSNAVQSQAGAFSDVILEWFVIPEIGLQYLQIIPNSDCWEKAIHRWTNWNLFSYKNSCFRQHVNTINYVKFDVK